MMRLTGPRSGSMFGGNVVPLADASGDGFPDLLITAETLPLSNGAGSGRGFLYDRGPDADTVADVTIFPPRVNDPAVFSGFLPSFNFGVAAAAIGDVDGD